MRVDPFYVQTLAGALTDATATEAELSGELASGLRVAHLSSDPVAVAQSTLLGAAINADDSYVQAAASAQSRLQVTSSTLGEVVSQLTQAIALATQGGNGTLSPANITSIGLQLSQIRGQVLALANTSYLGQHIFGGSQGSTAPFVQTGSTTSYVGDEALQYTTTENGQQIQTNVIGSATFDASGSSVFAALNVIVNDFATGAASDQIAEDVGSLTRGLATVSTQRSVVDTSLSQLQTTSTYAATDSAQLNAALSSLVAADPAKVATSLSNVETQSQALTAVLTALEKGSLFDYIGR